MRARIRRLLRQRLSTQVVIMMVAILVVTMAAGFAVVQWNLNRQLDDQYEQRSLAVAQSLASQPGLQQAVRTGGPGGIGPHGAVQSMAMAAMHSTAAKFVVVTNAKGIRLSHPNPRLIGTPVWYPDKDLPSSETFRTGQDWMGIEHGTLGVEAVGKAPIFGHGKLIGEVSVGFLTATVAGDVARMLVDLAVYFLAVLALGVLAALGLSRRLKRQTFGLELREIAALLQEREAMLHGIREGVLGYDKNERIVLANDFARQLLDLLPEFVGRPLRHVLPPGRLADVVTGEIEGSDLLVLHGDRVLVANRMPIRQGHRHLGWVVTFQDRTESEALKRQLDDAIGLTETLRAQSHEFANRLHTLVGLVELGRNDEAIQFVTDVSAARADLTERLQADIGDAKLVAMILGKVSLADERDVRLRVMDDSHVGAPISDISQVLTVAGNLIDNAIDAAAQAPGPRWVELTIVAVEHDLLVRVRDSGRGVPHDMRESVFMDGVTTKTSTTGARRGLGLALVRKVVEGRGGMISVGHDGGAVFTAVLPNCVGVDPRTQSGIPEAGCAAGAEGGTCLAMIRVVVVDDDFRIAGIHAAYVDKVDGFQAVAQAHTAAEAAGAVDRLRPDLLLLDLYLPDEHGLDLAARLRREGHPPVDVIVITAAKDADSVRAAMQGGALHYLLKPFSFPALRDKLLSYAQMRSRLGALHEPDQRNVDRVFGALRAQDQLAGAKGRSAHTLEAVERLLASGGQELSAAEVAEMTGMSRATAQRYLSHLHEIGRVQIRLRYGSGGRPEHRYRWYQASEH